MRRLVRAEGLVLAALALLAVAPLAGLLVRALQTDGSLSGGEGFVVVDQAQYLAWIREVAAHGLIGNPFDLAGGERAFLHPGLLVAGAIHRLGLDVVATFALFKLPAVLVLFAGALLWVRRFLPAGGARWAALAVALLSALPLAALVDWTGVGSETLKNDLDFLEGELWSGTYLWGYPFTAMAVGLLPLALLAYERGAVGAAAAAGLVCAWLQPWQGATLLLAVGGVEAWTVLRGGRPARAALRWLVPVGVASAAPLVYFVVLSRVDASWARVGEANQVDRWAPWLLALGLAPLVLPALAGLVRGRGARREASQAPADLGERLLVAWPLAALAVYVLPFGTFPPHALQGLAIPLAVLAVRGVAGLRLATPAVVAAALALLIVPGTLYRVDQLRGSVRFDLQPYVLEPGDRAALDWLETAPRAGGVLAPVYTGQLVPGHTGRETWLGNGSWTPDYVARERAAEALFAGRMAPERAAALVRDSGARYLLSDCHGRGDVGPSVAGVARLERRFGCAAVYSVL